MIDLAKKLVGRVHRSARRVSGQRRLNDIVSVFHQTHDELGKLIDAHGDKIDEIHAEADRLAKQVTDLHEERRTASEIRIKVREFLPPA